MDEDFSSLFGVDLSFLLSIRNALGLLFSGEWSEFIFRLKVYLGQIDLETTPLEDLNLSEERSYHYADSGGLHLEKILKTFEITNEDSIVDFGCGKGGALFTFSKYPFRKISGCEISPELAAIAEKNLKAMKVLNITVSVSDAADFKELFDYNYFYFFNPFPCTVMRSVVQNIVSSLEKRPRKATIIYCNPECHEVIVTYSPLNKTNEYVYCGLTYYIYTN